jgi:hypothetical protein
MAASTGCIGCLRRPDASGRAVFEELASRLGFLAPFSGVRQIESKGRPAGHPYVSFALSAVTSLFSLVVALLCEVGLPFVLRSLAFHPES